MAMFKSSRPNGIYMLLIPYPHAIAAAFAGVDSVRARLFGRRIPLTPATMMFPEKNMIMCVYRSNLPTCVQAKKCQNRTGVGTMLQASDRSRPNWGSLLYFGRGIPQHDSMYLLAMFIGCQGWALLTLSWDENWDSHSLVNGYPSFYPRIALVTPTPGVYLNKTDVQYSFHIYNVMILIKTLLLQIKIQQTILPPVMACCTYKNILFHK